MLNQLTRKSSPYVEIRFIHSDGKEHRYYSVVNDLTGSRLSAFDNNAPTIDESLSDIRKVIAAIKRKAQRVISVEGTI